MDHVLAGLLTPEQTVRTQIFQPLSSLTPAAGLQCVGPTYNWFHMSGFIWRVPTLSAC